jgi:hypothetical protein
MRNSLAEKTTKERHDPERGESSCPGARRRQRGVGEQGTSNGDAAREQQRGDNKTDQSQGYRRDPRQAVKRPGVIHTRKRCDERWIVGRRLRDHAGHIAQPGDRRYLGCGFDALGIQRAQNLAVRIE